MSAAPAAAPRTPGWTRGGPPRTPGASSERRLERAGDPRPQPHVSLAVPGPWIGPFLTGTDRGLHYLQCLCLPSAPRERGGERQLRGLAGHRRHRPAIRRDGVVQAFVTVVGAPFEQAQEIAKVWLRRGGGIPKVREGASCVPMAQHEEPEPQAGFGAGL